MNITFVNTEYLLVPPIRGGAVEEWIDKIAHHLKGHQVSVFSYDEQRKRSSEKKEHIRYFWYKPGFLGRLLLSTYRLPFKKDDSKWFYFPYSWWCAKKLSNIKPDIIHIHNRPHFVWMIRKNNPKAKIILHLHQVSTMEEENFWTKEFIESVDLFVGCSQFIADEIIKRYSVPKSKTAVFYNALDIDQFPLLSQEKERRETLRRESQNADKKVILYVGRLVENKGVHYAIEAVRNLVLKGFTDIKLIVCGARGYANREVTSYIQKLYNIAYEVNENIFFAGFVSYEKILDYYLMSDLVVIPSEVPEGFCLITIESMAVGVPVLASHRGGMPEIVQNGKTGVIVEEPSVASFERHIHEFLEHPNRFSKYSLAGRRMVEEKFTWDKVNQKVEKTYQELMNHAQS